MSSEDSYEFDINKIVELVESGIIGLGLIALAVIKLISFLERRKVNKAQIDLLRSQSAFNNMIPTRCEIESMDDTSRDNSM